MINIEKVENIIFDLGGVLLDIDFQRTYDKMSQILNTSFDPNRLQADALLLLDRYEMGEISTEVFIWNLQRLSIGTVPTGNQVVEAWNAMLIGWNPEKFNMLLTLRNQYNVFLLSNTNELHLQWIKSSLRNDYGLLDWDERFFDQTFYSHLIGMRKPDATIYRHVTEATGILPENTLFIDDLHTNIEGSKTVGWQTYRHDPKEDLINVIYSTLQLL